jgi:asparagine synthase (glutamine-hydrolysing)
MCGINGILSTNASTYKTNITQMNQALSHRGPDDEGTWHNDHVILGHRRLSIIDLSTAGHQPMVSSNGRFALVYNGEIYNFNEIKKELPDYPFTSHTDTEVILAAWQQWGMGCIHKFNGMFAFALWDNQEQTLFLVRDRLGIKPLYYTKTNGGLVFSSEVRALLASGLIDRKVNRNHLFEYLSYQTMHAPNTLVEGVQLLEPGHLLNITPKEVTNTTYWSASNTNQHGQIAYEDAKAEVHHLLQQSVKRRLVSDVPFGAFLSGGIDSSAVTGLMSQASNMPVNTFSVSFAEEQYSEARYARMVAGKFGTKHTNIHLTPQDFLNYLPAAMQSMDHPSGDGPNTWVVSKVTKDAGITMALSGLGGDELFCGYDIFTRALKLHKYRKLANVPVVLRRLAGNMLQLTGSSIAKQKMNDILSLPDWQLQSFYPLSRQVLHPRQIHQLLAIPANSYQPEATNQLLSAFGLQSSALSSVAQNSHSHLLSQTSLLEISTYMQNVLLRDTDQMSMASALEVRVPFLDHELVEFVLSLPDHIKYPRTPKKLLVDALEDLLPPEIVNRPKMGFLLPWEHWMKNELKAFCVDNLHHLQRIDEINFQGVTNLWQSFQKGDPLVTWSRVWPLVVLGHWLDTNNIT